MALRPLSSMQVPVRARFGLFARETRLYARLYGPVRALLGLYSRKTWLYPPWRVCRFPFVPVRATTPGTPGCTPLDVCARAHSCPFGPVRQGNLALGSGMSVHVPARARMGLYPEKTWLYDSGRVCTCPFGPVWATTPGTPGCTPLDVCARVRSCPF